MSRDIHDLCAFWGEWPFLNTGLWDAARLEGLLRRAGVTRAAVSPFGHALCRDEFAEDERFLADVETNPFFAPVAGVNLAEPHWPRRMDRLAAEGRFRGLILHPATRHFRLDDADLVAAFWAHPATRRLPVIVSMGIEEMRFKPAALASRAVSVEEVEAFLRTTPDGARAIASEVPLAQAERMMSAQGFPAERVTFDVLAADRVPFAEARPTRVESYAFASLAPVLAPEGTLRTGERSFPPEARDPILSTNARRFWPEAFGGG